MINSLSEYEMSAVLDSGFILTKNRIIEKVYELFGDTLFKYKNALKETELLAVIEADGKISRGENYRGLPYVVLDYPRQFGKTDVFAVRTFFWWGNFFSITLQMGGVYQKLFATSMEKAIRLNELEGWYIGQGEDPWQHHFEDNNYRLIKPDKDYNLATVRYIKIAKKIPLEKWDDAGVFFKESFSFLVKVLTSQAPMR